MVHILSLAAFPSCRFLYRKTDDGWWNNGRVYSTTNAGWNSAKYSLSNLPGESTEFSNKILDRFRNPYIEPKVLAITVQYSSKMKLHNIPLLLQFYKTTSDPPELMAFSFAAHIFFMHCREENGKFFGNYHGNKY